MSRGLGFLRNGIIDQHFSHYRGRLGRLARAAIEEHVRFGFGIDEDTALIVSTSGTLEVLGPGHVTIVDTAGATCQDGPLGCSIKGVHLLCLAHGDRFDPTTGKVTIHPSKKPIQPGKEGYNGNFLIPDIAGRGAVLLALFGGLGNNTRQQQVGVALKHNRHCGHGFQYTFSKTERTQCYEGMFQGVDVEAVIHVRLDIEPVSVTLGPPKTGLPRDLPDGLSRRSLEAISHRGIMLANEQGDFRPDEPVTRGELACALAQTIRLEPRRSAPPVINDVPLGSSDADEISLVVTAGLMTTEEEKFRPADSISRQEAATVLVRLMERYRSKVLKSEPVELKDTNSIAPKYRADVYAAFREKLLAADQDLIRPQASLTRSETAEALFRILDFPWDK